MKSPMMLTGPLLFTLCHCSHIHERATDAISSCGSTWMSSFDVSIAQGTDSRPGYGSAVQQFCAAANGQTVKPNGYLSMASEVLLNGGSNPASYGVLGFVYFEVHNKKSSDHRVTHDSCVNYLQTLSAGFGKCSGTTNHDTKGGTFQIGNKGVSYHALGNEIPPQQDGLNKLFLGVLTSQTANKGSGPPLNPWPFDALDSVEPTTCHSHNDYDRNVPIFSAMSAGCVSIEADVFLTNGQAVIGHSSPQSGRSLSAQYIQPLKAILDHNNGGSPGSKGVYKSRPQQSLVLMVDFKSSDDALLDAVVEALEPLRNGGYLSNAVSGSFIERPVTVVASGSASFTRISSGAAVPGRDIFYDAKLDQWDPQYTNLNSYYASADFKSAIGNPGSAESFTQDQRNRVNEQVAPAHAAGLMVRYWNLPGDYMWESLAVLGNNRSNADDMYDTARLARIA